MSSDEFYSSEEFSDEEFSDDEFSDEEFSDEEEDDFYVQLAMQKKLGMSENSITSPLSISPDTSDIPSVTPAPVNPPVFSQTIYPSVAPSTVTFPSVTPSTVTSPSVAPSTVTFPSVTPSTVTFPSVAPSTVTFPSVTPSTVTFPSVTPSTVTFPSVTPIPEQEEIILDIQPEDTPFPQIVTVGGSSFQGLVAPQPIVILESISDLLKQDPQEELQRYNFRRKYTMIAEQVLGSDPNYTPERIISIGRAKVNKIYDHVAYPVEIERDISRIDSIQQ